MDNYSRDASMFILCFCFVCLLLHCICPSNKAENHELVVITDVACIGNNQ
ncbi:hypothetical protein NGUA35_01356 [Salmonella enterica]|nr:hypothetical protein NGUA03_01280 [Salmonella enterica]GAR13316.1 hypothetical protein NGUA04_03932 [Salmonella enterica]GAR32320.1 hypothetical protein NGUA09_00828 [Salmonella enterica]GAR37363.1 hypothetical protein NGUA10_01386 [Salmonella enterica]GAR91933.1 hypothetical protein NGUA22_01455 [Salmonella enterica]